jgi:predicted nucleic acid-binding Zn ribbon protein
MGQRKCEVCGEPLSKSNIFELKVPEEECKHCGSDVYSEYHFCSAKCTQSFVNDLVDQSEKV